MNTINIFLKPTGSVAELQKDFPIYVGSYKTNYVKVYVLPTMMPVVENVNYGLALSGKFTLDNGSDFVAEPTWLEALPDETITSRNVETTYKVFGAYLPRKLCSYAGNQTLILNLQSINSVTNEFISVITTQEANVLIQRSAYVLVDETPEPGQYEQINGRVTDNEEDILDLQNDITDINTRIDNLPLSEDYIGSFSGTTQPFDDGVITDVMVALLNAEVAEIKGESYVKKNGDVLIYTYQITGETDKNYKFIYTTNDTWTGYEIPALEVAGNGSLGIVEGTEGTGSTNDVIVDIGSGQIRNIKFKDNGNYVALGTIPTTYQTKAEGATKTYVREYSLPREFNDIYYLANTGYQKTVPTAPSSGIQYTATSSAVGDTTLFTCSFMNTADFELSAKNSTNNNIYIKATANATLQFRMTTQYRKNGEADWTDLSIELTGDIPFVANQLQKVQFGSAMTELGDDMVVMTNGDQLRQILEVITETSDTISFEIYSNSTYPSIFNLNTQLATLVIGNLLERMEGSEYISVDENESNTKIEFKIHDNKIETSAPQNGSSKLITSGAVYNAIPQIDEVSITENASNKIQASKLKDKDVKIGENSVNKADFNGVVELSEAQYQELLANGTITVDGQTITFDETAYYNTPDDGGTTQVYTKAETNALLDEKVDKKPDGTHDLIDSNNKITDTYLPDYLLGQLLYGGTFNASTDVATLSDNAKAKLGVSDNTILLTNDTTPVTGYADNEGIFYVTSTSGTFASITFDVGDWLLSSGSAWQRIANTDAVTGVKGNAEENYRIGQVNLTPANIGTYSSSEIDTAVGAKLDKVITSDSNERVYAVDEHGTQEMKALESGTGMAAPTVNTVVLRGGGGVVSCGTPTQAYHAANKYYVDTYGGKINAIYVNNSQMPITSNKEVFLSVPTTTNDLTNNSGFITNAVSNLYNYYLKSETYNKGEILNLIAGVEGGISFEIVTTLPTATAETYFNVSKTIYLVANQAEQGDYYEEYVTLRSGTEGSYVYTWEKIGNTQINLRNMVDGTGTGSVIANDLLHNVASGTNSFASGTNNTVVANNGHAEGYSVTLASDRGITASSTDAEIETEWLASDPESDKFSFVKGENGHIEGSNNLALGQNTHAEGNGTRALNNSAHTEGTGTVASGKYSHAEGLETIASGGRAHTEGDSTQATADYTHAEGRGTKAYGKYAHTEGRDTQVNTNIEYGHAEGRNTTVAHSYGHTEGQGTITSRSHQHVSGKYNTGDSTAYLIVGDGSSDSNRSNCFSAGNDGTNKYIRIGTKKITDANAVTKDVNDLQNYYTKQQTYSQTEVNNSFVPKTTTIAGVDLQDNITASELKTAMSLPSSIEGTANNSIIMNDIIGNIASGDCCFAEGKQNTASGALGAHAEGYLTTASGPHAHSEGELATASGQDSHAEGWYSTASGYGTHAEGGRTSATFEYAHAEGQYTTANGFASHAEGCQTTTGAVARQSHTEGYFCQSHNYQSHSEGDYSIAGFNDDTVATFDISATYAENTVVKNGTGLYYLCIKASTGNALDNTTYWNLIQSNHAEGQNTRSTSVASHAEGVNSVASGKASHAEGNGTYATNNSSHSEGTGSQATGKYSHAEGLESVASGSRSHAEGYQTTASGDSAHAQGRDTVASGKYSSASGRGTTASKENQTALGQYNATDNEALFIVGTGSKSGDTINARNSFATGHDGTESFVKVGTTKFRESEIAKKTDITAFFSAITGYDASKTQVLKNIQGTLTWVDEV